MRYIDTGSNYFSFESHQRLAKVAGDLLADFHISTKVGFFRSRQGVENSLDPERLSHAVAMTGAELGRSPDIILLHNPELTISSMPGPEGRETLFRAMDVLHEASASGYCRGWGISTWEPQALSTILDGADVPDELRPDVLLTRAGLLVRESAITAGETLAHQLGVVPTSHWGMSPFGGISPRTLLAGINCCQFIRPGQDCTNVQAAFRTSFFLPTVQRVVVGTDNHDHLSELVGAASLAVDKDRITRYRERLRIRQSTRHT